MVKQKVSEKIRKTRKVDVDLETHSALRLRAIAEGITLSELSSRLLRKAIGTSWLQKAKELTAK